MPIERLATEIWHSAAHLEMHWNLLRGEMGPEAIVGSYGRELATLVEFCKLSGSTAGRLVEDDKNRPDVEVRLPAALELIGQATDVLKLQIVEVLGQRKRNEEYRDPKFDPNHEFAWFATAKHVADQFSAQVKKKASIDYGPDVSLLVYLNMPHVSGQIALLRQMMTATADKNAVKFASVWVISTAEGGTRLHRLRPNAQFDIGAEAPDELLPIAERQERFKELAGYINQIFGSNRRS